MHILGGIAASAIPSITTDVSAPHVVRLSVCLYVTLVHPAKAVGRNELSFGRDTRKKFPRVYTRTTRYCSFVNHALNNYQDKITDSTELLGLHVCFYCRPIVRYTFTYSSIQLLMTASMIQ